VGRGANVLQERAGWGAPHDGLRATCPMGPTFFVGGGLTSRIDVDYEVHECHLLMVASFKAHQCCLRIVCNFSPLNDRLFLWGTNRFLAASLDLILFLDFLKLFLNMRLGKSFVVVQIL
jgi:hypothetical protein